MPLEILHDLTEGECGERKEPASLADVFPERRHERPKDILSKGEHNGG